VKPQSLFSRAILDGFKPSSCCLFFQPRRWLLLKTFLRAKGSELSIDTCPAAM